jgi:VWFA-related protein
VRFAALFLAGTVLAQQSSIIKVPVRFVTVPTLVFSEQGKLISGLESKDFELYDDGHPQIFKLDSDISRYAIVVAVQASQSVRAYLPFIDKVGSTLENSLQAQTGEAAVLEYEDDVTILKQFGSGDVESAIRKITAGGEKVRMLDAAARAITLLNELPPSFSRILLLIGQSYDSGSSTKLSSVLGAAESEGVSVFTLTLPIFGKNFVSDTFALNGLPDQFYKGGYVASVELTKLGPALKRSAKAKENRDPFALLTAQTGGMMVHFRKQSQLENALIALGGALHSAYLLSYAPQPLTSGYHTISVKVDLPGATTHARLGYQAIKTD